METFPLVAFKLLQASELFCLSHTGLFYGGVCIAMAALASLLGALLQVGARVLFPAHVKQLRMNYISE